MASSDDLSTSGGGSKPDPTMLTTQQLLRELANLQAIIEARLDASDKAIELLQAYPTRIDEKISALKELHGETFRGMRELVMEKFASIEKQVEKQFEERDTRTEGTAQQTSKAVDAALSAAKEAVEKQNQSSALAISKSETSTFKQIDALAELIKSTSKTSDEKITDIKDRLTRLEGRGEGSEGKVKSSQQSTHLVIAGVALLISVVMAVLVVVKMAL